MAGPTNPPELASLPMFERRGAARDVGVEVLGDLFGGALRERGAVLGAALAEPSRVFGYASARVLPAVAARAAVDDANAARDLVQWAAALVHGRPATATCATASSRRSARSSAPARAAPREGTMPGHPGESPALRATRRFGVVRTRALSNQHASTRDVLRPFSA